MHGCGRAMGEDRCNDTSSSSDSSLTRQRPATSRCAGLHSRLLDLQPVVYLDIITKLTEGSVNVNRISGNKVKQLRQ